MKKKLFVISFFAMLFAFTGAAFAQSHVELIDSFGDGVVDSHTQAPTAASDASSANAHQAPDSDAPADSDSAPPSDAQPAPDNAAPAQ